MESKVKEHYHADTLLENIKTALTQSRKDLSTLGLKDLSPIDQLHTGGARFSLDLFKKAALAPGSRVLDAGCGLGGTSRLLAETFHCRVTGIDLADSFIQAAEYLTRLTCLENLVDFRQGSVLMLPFEDHAFDAVVCQHLLMNIEDKPGAVKEFFRVLKPHGQLILHEIFRGNNTALSLPVPWAGTDAISFLEPWDLFVSNTLEKYRFKLEAYADASPEATRWWKKAKTMSDMNPFSLSTLGPGLIFGENARFFGQNMHANFSRNAICLVEAILKKGYTV